MKNKRILNEEILRISQIMGINSKLFVSEQTQVATELASGVEEFWNKLFGEGDAKLAEAGAKNAQEISTKLRELSTKGIEKLTEDEALFLTQLSRAIYGEAFNKAVSNLKTNLLGSLNNDMSLYTAILKDIRENPSIDEVMTKASQVGLDKNQVLAIREVEKDVTPKPLDNISVPKAEGKKVEDKPSETTPETVDASALNNISADRIEQIIDSLDNEGEFPSSENNFTLNESILRTKAEAAGITDEAQLQSLINKLKEWAPKTDAEADEAIETSIRAIQKKYPEQIKNSEKMKSLLKQLWEAGKKRKFFRFTFWLIIEAIAGNLVLGISYLAKVDKSLPTLYAIFQFLAWRGKSALETLGGEVSDVGKTLERTTGHLTLQDAKNEAKEDIIMADPSSKSDWEDFFKNATFTKLSEDGNILYFEYTDDEGKSVSNYFTRKDGKWVNEN